jgi:hypothetical protein
MLMVRDETARILDGLSLADANVPEEAEDRSVPTLDQDPEQRAAALALGERDRAAMGEDDLAGEAEADAGALRLGGEEGEEDVLRRASGTPGPLSATSIWTRPCARRLEAQRHFGRLAMAARRPRPRCAAG